MWRIRNSKVRRCVYRAGEKSEASDRVLLCLPDFSDKQVELESLLKKNKELEEKIFEKNRLIQTMQVIRDHCRQVVSGSVCYSAVAILQSKYEYLRRCQSTKDADEMYNVGAPNANRAVDQESFLQFRFKPKPSPATNARKNEKGIRFGIEKCAV